VTTFPAPVVAAATWNVQMEYEYGQAVGIEQKMKGRNVVLGPSMDIIRSPLWGRAGESFSEDTFLTTRSKYIPITNMSNMTPRYMQHSVIFQLHRSYISLFRPATSPEYWYFGGYLSDFFID
jgi:hypothetical protein